MSLQVPLVWISLEPSLLNLFRSLTLAYISSLQILLSWISSGCFLCNLCRTLPPKPWHSTCNLFVTLVWILLVTFSPAFLLRYLSRALSWISSDLSLSLWTLHRTLSYWISSESVSPHKLSTLHLSPESLHPSSVISTEAFPPESPQNSFSSESLQNPLS